MKIEQLAMKDLEEYKSILRGDKNRFHRGIWKTEWVLESAKLMTKYLIEEVLKLDDSEVIKLSAKTIHKYQLGYLLNHLFSGSVRELIENAYPGKYKPWQFTKSPIGFFKNKDNIVEAVRWIVETKLNNDEERVYKEFNMKLLDDNGLRLVRAKGLYNLLEMAYPNKYDPNKFKERRLKHKISTEETVQKVKKLIEEQIGTDREQIRTKFNRKFLVKNHLYDIANLGTYNLLQMVYPNEFKPWEIKFKGYYIWDNRETAKKAMKWLVNEKTNLSADELDADTIKRYLGSSIVRHYKIADLREMCKESS